MKRYYALHQIAPQVGLPESTLQRFYRDGMLTPSCIVQGSAFFTVEDVRICMIRQQQRERLAWEQSLGVVSTPA